MEAITQLQLQTRLLLVNSATFASLATVTDPDMYRTDNPFRRTARKVTFATVTLCWYYKDAKRRQQAAAGQPADFKPKPRQWGVRIPKTPLVAHRLRSGKCHAYLEAMVPRSRAHYFRSDTGERIDQELAPFLKNRTSDPTEPRDYKLANVAEITLNGTRYTVAPAADELGFYFPDEEPAAIAQ